jgi:hypothetical protein
MHLYKTIVIKNFGSLSNINITGGSLNNNIYNNKEQNLKKKTTFQTIQNLSFFPLTRFQFTNR